MSAREYGDWAVRSIERGTWAGTAQGNPGSATCGLRLNWTLGTKPRPRLGGTRSGGLTVPREGIPPGSPRPLSPPAPPPPPPPRPPKPARLGGGGSACSCLLIPDRRSTHCLFSSSTMVPSGQLTPPPGAACDL